MTLFPYTTLFRSIYETGSGKIKLRGRVEVEQDKGGKLRLVITEIPYTIIGANIGKFLNDVYALVESKKTTDIIDISNQSSKEGIRIVLELKKQTDVDNLLALLYKKTRLEDTFSVNMLAIADGRPETLGLNNIIEYFLDFQYDLTTRKYQKLLAKELEKQEIKEGLMRATDIIDLIIEILRGSKNIKQAKACLMTGTTEGIRFKSKASERAASALDFTERQATAILEMRLYKLIGLEMDALLKDHDATLKNIASYKDILENHKSMSRVISHDLDMIKKTYATPRKTSIENVGAAVYEEKKAEAMEVVVLIDRFGYAKTIDKATFEKVQELLLRDTRTSPQGRTVHLFSGFLKCADCGRAVTRCSGKNNVYYACATYKSRSRNACTMHSISHARLEAAVLYAIRQQVHLAVSYSEVIAQINSAPIKKKPVFPTGRYDSCKRT